MNTWRLIAHHKDAKKAIHWRQECYWMGNIGDLRRSAPQDASAITSLIQEVYPELNNANLGGPSLWRFYSEMAIGDLVLLSDGNKMQAVMRVTGNYEWIDDLKHELSETYYHQRSTETTQDEPDELWKHCGAKVAVGENIRWTLIRCNNPRNAHRSAR